MKLKYTFLACCMFLCAGLLKAQSNWQWGKSLIGNNEDNIADVATDAAGNVYVCGTIVGSGTLGGLPFNTSQATSSAYPFVAKYNSSGALLWSNVASFSGGATVYTVYPRSITVDKTGNVYMAMTATCNQSSGTVDFGGAGGAVFATCTNAIVIKLNQNGAGQWGAYTYAGNNANQFNAAQLVYDTASSKLFYGFSIVRTSNGGSQALLYNSGSASANYIVDIDLSGGQESIYGELNAATGAFNGYYRIGGNDNSGGKEWIRDMKADGLGNIYIGAELLYGTNFYHNGSSFSITAPSGNPYMKVIKLNSSLTHQGSTTEFTGPTSVFNLNEISINSNGEPVTLCSYDGASAEHVVEVRRFSSSLSSLGVNTVQYATGEALFSGKGLSYDINGNIWATVGTSAVSSSATYAWSPSFAASSAISNVSANHGLLVMKISSSGSWLDYSLLSESGNNQFSVSNKLLPGKVATSGNSVYICGETYFNLSSGSNVLATGGNAGNGYLAKYGCDPLFTTQPQSITICGTQQVTFATVVSGSVTAMQWKKNGVNINGANNDTLIIANATAADTGSYTLTVTNSCGSSVSSAATLSAPATATIATTGLVINMPFISGSLADAGPNTLTASGNGSATADKYGNSAQALALNGSQNVSFSNDATMNVSNQLTISMWFKASNIANAQRLIDKTPVGQNSNYMLDLYQSKLRCIIAGSAFQSTQTFSSNTWYHIAVTYDGANVKFYLNGSLLQTFAKTGNCTANTSPLVIGSDLNGSSQFTGSLDEVRLYTRALSAIEVANLIVVPALLAQPQSVGKCVGTTASFTVAGTGTNVTYQWFKNGNAIAGATSSVYTIPSVSANDTAKYTCQVANSCVYTQSTAAALTLVTGATISQQPQSVAACAGTPATFSVSTTGGTASYIWRKNGTLINGANSAFLFFNPVSASDSGMYVCVVISACGAQPSDTVKLDVAPVTSITGQPTGSQVLCEGGLLNLSVTATGKANTFQWKLNGNNISGANLAGYSKSGIAAADTGDYTVVVSGTCGNQTSANAKVSLRPIPVFVTQPSSMSNCPGSDINLFAYVSEVGMTYQWFKDGNLISGFNGNTYFKQGATTADSGQYHVVATGVCNSISSNVVLVAIHSNPAPVVLRSGAVLTSSVSGSSYQWYLNSNALSGATAQSYTATQNGDYTVSVVSAAGCTGTSPALNVNLTGVEMPHQVSVQVYPNPVSDILHIQFTKAKPGMQVEILTAAGKVVRVAEAGNTTIDVSDLRSGFYFVRVVGVQQGITRFVKL